eukprot:1148812-Pelagomonas_calceolata.AAC.19
MLRLTLAPNPSRWTSHLVFAVNGLHHAHGFQQKVCLANLLDMCQLSWILGPNDLHIGDNFPVIILEI